MPGTHKKGPMGYHTKGSSAYHKKGSTAYHGPKAMYDGPMGHMHMGPKAMKSATEDGGQIAAKKPGAPAKQIAREGAAAMYGPKAHKKSHKNGGDKKEKIMLIGPDGLDKDGKPKPLIAIDPKKEGTTAMYGPKAHHGPKAMKSKQRVEQDYARNVIHDKETGHNKAAAYEKKKLTQVAAGEGYFTRHKWHHKAFKGR